MVDHVVSTGVTGRYYLPLQIQHSFVAKLGVTQKARNSGVNAKHHTQQARNTHHLSFLLIEYLDS